MAQVDPISTALLTVFSVTTALMLGIIAPITLLPASYAIAVGSGGVVAGVTVIAGVMAVLYNGVDLSEVRWYELLFVFIVLTVTVANEFAPVVSTFVTEWAPFSNIILYVLGWFALLIMAYGDGVSWYPFR